MENELGGPVRCSDACTRLKVVDYRRRFDGLRDFAEMAVMGEVDHLARGGHSREQAKCLFRSKIVERLHDVVGEKRGGSVSPREFVIPGYRSAKYSWNRVPFDSSEAILELPSNPLAIKSSFPFDGWVTRPLNRCLD